MKHPDRSLHPLLKGALMTLLLIAVYLIVAIPFKVMEIIPGFADIRPVMLLQPIYGVFFGIPGCIASAVGNLICDAISDSMRWSCIGGFIANFIGPFVFYLYCTRITKTEFRLNSPKRLLIHSGLIFFSAALQVLIITPMVEAFYPEVFSMLFALSVMLNTSLFPLFIGIPIMILMQEELGFRPLKRKRKTTVTP